MTGSGAFGWVLALSAAAVGWPIPRGGSQAITNALVGYFESLGGKVEANQEVKDLRDLPQDALVLCDVTPCQLLRMGAGSLPDSYRKKLQRYRYGPGVFKLDWALTAPIPWSNADSSRAGTVHLGGTLDEISRSERAAWDGSPCGESFRSAGSAESVRPIEGTGGKAHSVGVLSCSEWIERGHEPSHRGASRTFCTGLSGHDPGPARAFSSGYGSAQCQPGGGRYQRRSRESQPVCSSAHAKSLSDARILAFLCARRPRHPAAASTECAAIMPPERRSRIFGFPEMAATRVSAAFAITQGRVGISVRRGVATLS